MLPRMPIAAGIRMKSPGRTLRVWVIEASVRPVTRSPPDEIRSAKKPARTPAKSERNERDEARDGTARESKHCGLGGSDT